MNVNLMILKFDTRLNVDLMTLKTVSVIPLKVYIAVTPSGWKQFSVLFSVQDVHKNSIFR